MRRGGNNKAPIFNVVQHQPKFLEQLRMQIRQKEDD